MDLENESLKICNQKILAKENDQYLGDFLHESVEATVSHRYGRIFSAIIEVSSILEDYRIDTIGGLKAGLDIFEMALIPSLLNNSEIWIEMDKQTTSRLEHLQNSMFRNLFAVPNSTSIPMLRFL